MHAMKIILSRMLLVLTIASFILSCSSGGGSGSSGGSNGTPPSSAKAITAFSLTTPAATGIINEVAKTISITVLSGTNVTALIVALTTTGAEVKVGNIVQVSGTTPNNFTNPVSYAVSAADGSSVSYIITVTVQPLIVTGQVTTLAGTADSDGSADGTGAAARFNNPTGITSDGTNLYVTDYDNYTIRKIVIATGEVTTFAGMAGGAGSEDGTGTAARFLYPNGITSDGTNLYVVDNWNHTIRKIVITTAEVTTLAGTAGSRGSADGTGATARFNNPDGITGDGTNLYVADTYNYTIRKIMIATGEVTTFAGTAESYGSADGTGTAARFHNPNSITSDGTNLYVADTINHTIRKIIIATGEVTTFAGTARSIGSADGTGATARFDTPFGITSDGTSLYVADNLNHTIRKISL